MRPIAVVPVLAVALAGFAAATPTVAGAATPKPAACADGSITTTEAAGVGSLSHDEVRLIFRNITAHTCTLRGYPGVAGLNSSGRQILQASRTQRGYAGGSARGVQTITVPAGGRVSARVEGIDDAGACGTDVVALQVTPPGLHHAIKLKGGLPSCHGGLQVHPVVVGTRGSDV